MKILHITNVKKCYCEPGHFSLQYSAYCTLYFPSSVTHIDLHVPSSFTNLQACVKYDSSTRLLITISLKEWMESQHIYATTSRIPI